VKVVRGLTEVAEVVSNRCAFVFRVVKLWILKQLGNFHFFDKFSVVCFLLGNSPASEFYMPTFRNALFHLHGQVGAE